MPIEDDRVHSVKREPSAVPVQCSPNPELRAEDVKQKKHLNIHGIVVILTLVEYTQKLGIWHSYPLQVAMFAYITG